MRSNLLQLQKKSGVKLFLLLIFEENKMTKILIVLLYFVSFHLIAQEHVELDSIQKTNPIIFAESYVGIGGGSSFNFFGGLGLNYQFGKTDLITFRTAAIIGTSREYAALSPIIILPFLAQREVQVEYGLLYGKRWTYGNYSLSGSAGISHFNRKYFGIGQEENNKLYQNYFGVPFEFNIKFFKENKQRFRAYYGLIPIGKKKVSFGRSVGFKLTGNIAKHSNLGIGINYGFGWHKKY